MLPVCSLLSFEAGPWGFLELETSWKYVLLVFCNVSFHYHQGAKRWDLKCPERVRGPIARNDTFLKNGLKRNNLTKMVR